MSAASNAILLLGKNAPELRGCGAQLSHESGDGLTARERDVLAMIGYGLSNKCIARALEISPETVKTHVKHIFEKMAVGTRSAAAFRAGLLRLHVSG
jgi:two-component system, NarL family, nitrate/nitrite response regulator NarL